MKRSQRLDSVVKIAESEEQGAARELGECQRQLEEHQSRLSQLQSFRLEYTSRLQQRAGLGISALQMQSYHAFIAQLDRGIEEQRRVIQSVLMQVEYKKQHWFTKRIRTQAMDKVRSQYVYQEQLMDNKQEQKECDERAQNMRSELMAFE
jgi:flagellar FliJ protein